MLLRAMSGIANGLELSFLVLVLISSVLGNKGVAGVKAAYAASKAGLSSLGESLRAEYARAHQAAAALLAADVVQAVTQERWQLQFEEAEHRQGQDHKQRGETAEDPRGLQQRRQVAAEQQNQRQGM